MSTPFVAQSLLTYPPDDGEAAVDRSNTVNSSYDEKAEFKYVLTGGGSQAVDFGSIDTTGAKAIQVEMDAANTAAVMVQFNGGGASGQLELSAGGHFDLASPNPTALGVLAMTLVHTVDSTVWVRILG
jgi:hypothetical protein